MSKHFDCVYPGNGAQSIPKHSSPLTVHSLPLDTSLIGLTGLTGAGAHAQGRSVGRAGAHAQGRFVERALHPVGMHALQSNASPRAFRRADVHAIASLFCRLVRV